MSETTSSNGAAEASFDGKVVVVTGASRGIGRACALALAERGAHVVALARTQGALEELDDEIRALGGPAPTLAPVDMRDGDALDRLGQVVQERWGKLDGLVANAGVLGPLTPTAQITVKDWDEAIAINLTSNFRLVRATDALLRAAPAGRAVFMTSTAAQAPRAYNGVYAATKGGLESFVSAYAAELVNTNVRINCLNPGGTKTAMRRQAFPGEDTSKLATPEEVAASVLAMLDPQFEHATDVFLHPVTLEGPNRISDFACPK